MLNKEHLDQIQTAIDAEVAKYLKELPRTVQRILNEATVAMIGLESDPWGKKSTKTRYRVNNSDKSPSWLKHLIEERVRAFVDANIAKALKTIKVPTVEEIVVACAQKLRDDYRYNFNQRLQKDVNALAEKHAAGVVEKLEQALQEGKSLADLNRDVEDPGSFPGQVGEFVLEIEARGMVR